MEGSRCLHSLIVILWTSSLAWAAGPPPVLDLDQGKLSPKLRWLQTERLRGALMHRAIVNAFPTRYLRRVSESTPRAASAPIALRGQHVLVISGRRGQPLTIDLKALDGRPEFADTVFALYSPSSRLVEMGAVARGSARKVTVAKAEAVEPSSVRGEYVLLLNPGIAFDNVWGMLPEADAWEPVPGVKRPDFKSRITASEAAQMNLQNKEKAARTAHTQAQKMAATLHARTVAFRTQGLASFPPGSQEGVQFDALPTTTAAKKTKSKPAPAPTPS